MALIPIPLGPISDKSRSSQGGGATLTNCYAEKTEGGKTPFTLNAFPRLKAFATVSSGAPGRGAIALGNNLYVVCGEYAYKVSSTGSATLLGIVLGQKPVIMSVNRKATGQQIAITADTKNYVIEADALSEITDADLPSGVHSNAYLNGRTVYGINDGLAYASDDEEATSIDGLSFAEAERSADNGVRVFTYGEEFWYFGEKSREVFRYDADTTFPFAPLLGAGQGDGDGCAAKNSVAIVGKPAYWVNENKVVVASTGGAAQRVSTHDVDRDIAQTIKDGYALEITGFSLSVEGHDFYYLRSPQWCWVLDTTSGGWFRRESYGAASFVGGFAVQAFSKDLVLDATDGILYEHSFEVETDSSTPFVVKIVTSPPNAYPQGYTCNFLSVDCARGVGILSGTSEATDPQMMLRVSRDGGKTYGNTYTRPMGAQGVYAKEVRFNRLGSARGVGMTFELSVSAPVERAVFSAVADLDALA